MPKRRLNATDLITATQVTSVKVAPDAQKVIFETRQMLLDENKYLYELWMVDVTGGEPTRLTENPPVDPDFGMGLAPTWSPDSRRCAFYAPGKLGISVMDVETREVAEVVLSGDLQGLIPASSYEAIIFGGFSWATSESLALVAAVAPPTPPAPTNSGVVIDVMRGPIISSHQDFPHGYLCLVDASSGEGRRVTGDDFSVRGFTFSPDGTQVVVAADPVPASFLQQEQNLYRVDLETGEFDPLVVRAGVDTRPCWSPDGRYIAFLTHGGQEDTLHTMLVAIVSASGGEVRHLTEEFREKETSPGPAAELFWSNDSEQIYFGSTYRMSRQLFRVSRDGGGVELVTRDLERWHSRISAVGDRVAFVAESLTTPGDVYSSLLSDFEPVRLTDLNPKFLQFDLPSVERVGWRSSDDKWDIDALLVLPPGHKEGDRRPLVVEIVGGPVMVSSKFSDGNPHPILLFASEGYGVIIPNTRGRSGGYPYDFAHAIETERGHGHGPLRDVLDALDFAVERGFADEEQVAVVGHSYGGYLVAFALTQTDRFKTAIFHEGSVDDVTHQLMGVANPSARLLTKEMFGYGNPFDPDEFENIRAQSPIHNMGAAKTPTLIEVGETSPAVAAGSLLAQALHFLGVPYELVVYPRTGHLALEPILIKDDMERDVAWLRRWLRRVGGP